jgi:hypothetical protein
MTEHDQTDENGQNLQNFTDGPPTPQQPTHHHHCLIQSTPDKMSKRIKRNNGETMTKMKKGRARLPPPDAHSHATGLDSFLNEYSANIDTGTTDTSVSSIRLYWMYLRKDWLHIGIAHGGRGRDEVQVRR